MAIADLATQGDARMVGELGRIGFARPPFDKCLEDKDLFGKIVKQREIGHEKFQVQSTPTFFINGKRLKGDHKIEDFQIAFGEKPAKTDDGAAKPDEGAAKTEEPPAQGQ